MRRTFLAVVGFGLVMTLWTPAGALDRNPAASTTASAPANATNKPDAPAENLAPFKLNTRASLHFDVYGVVTDPAGKPMNNVRVQAHCGNGTLRITGEAQTDRDGKYKLGFGPGIFFSDPKHPVGFQVATISPVRRGYYERDLAARGNLAITDRDDVDEKIAKTFVNVLRPDEPVEVNFVMLPAATIRGQLLDAKGKPLAVKSISIGSQKLPPSSNAIATGQTDVDGRFRIQSVPAIGPCWFNYSTADGKTLSSLHVDFSRGGAYRYQLTVDEQAADEMQRLRWELVETPDTPQDDDAPATHDAAAAAATAEKP